MFAQAVICLECDRPSCRGAFIPRITHACPRLLTPSHFAHFGRSTPQIPSACIPAGGSGWLAVADSDNRRVQLVTLTGQVIRVLAGDQANGLGQLGNSIRGIAVSMDAQDDPELLVADSRNNRVVAFRLDGRAARVVCGTKQKGSGAGQLDHPVGLAVTATGDLWVVECNNNRVSWFR